MAFFISERIRQREFGREISAADKKALSEGARVCLGASITGHGLPKGTRLLKAYSTTKQGLAGSSISSSSRKRTSLCFFIAPNETTSVQT